jgi:apolipoprotein N-acyltransferase
MSLRRRTLLALLAGFLLSFAFPKFDLAFLAWVAIVPLLLLLDTVERKRDGFLIGMVFGIGFFGALLIWISIVGWIAWVLLVLLEAAFLGLFGLLYVVIGRRPSFVLRTIAVPSLWVAVEYFRGNVPLGGFTWGQLVQSQHNLTYMMKPAALGGGWLVTFIVVAINAFGAEAIRRRAEDVPRILLPAGLAIMAMLIPFAVPANGSGTEAIRVAIVQGNVPLNFAGSLYEKEVEIIRSHTELTLEIEPGSVDLIVWPESSVGIDPNEDVTVAELITGAAQTVGAPLIVGGNLDVDDDHYKVMALLVSADGEVVDAYQKTHLVPFGEFLPARAALDWIPILDQIPRDAIPADHPVIFDLAGSKVATVISFEGDFGSLVRGRMAMGGRLLVVATNTSTWGDTGASPQHLAFSQVRAIENGVWVAHDAISGISGFIAPNGDVMKKTELRTADVIIQEMYFADDITLYARVGDWLPLLCLLGSAVAVAISVRRRRADRVRR